MNYIHKPFSVRRSVMKRIWRFYYHVLRSLCLRRSYMGLGDYEEYVMSKYGQIFERLSNQGADQEDLLLLIRLERAANQNHWAETIDKAVKFGMKSKDATKLAAEVRLVTLKMREEAEKYENS